MKSCLLTENYDNLNKIFQPDKEIVTYNNLDDLYEKIKYLCSNKKVAQQIAEAGHI